MLRIFCPDCGVRDEPEFTFGGPSHLARPGPDVSDAEWTGYLYSRQNPKGAHCERWRHSFGCGRWFNVVRNTVNNELLAVYRMGEHENCLSEPDDASDSILVDRPLNPI